MTTSLFSALVKQHFKYLADDYGYSISREDYYPEATGNAEVWFNSALTGIRIVLDRGQVLITIGLLSQPESDWFELYDVVHFFGPNQTVYEFPENFSDYEAALESQISRLAHIVIQYCGLLLNGDFSMQNEIREVEKSRVNKMLEEFNELSQKQHKG